MISFKVVKTLAKEFWLEVNGRTYRIPEGWNTKGELQSFTKHSLERVSKNRFGHDGPAHALGDSGMPKGNKWPQSPGIMKAELSIPISALASALEVADPILTAKRPGRHFPILVGDWELGIQTTEEPWCVFHSRLLR